MPEGEKVNFAAEFNKTRDELMTMDETEFRARFRERCHHTLEIQTYSCAYRGSRLRPEQTQTVEKFLDVWKARGLPVHLPEYTYAQSILALARKLQAGEAADLSPFLFILYFAGCKKAPVLQS